MSCGCNVKWLVFTKERHGANDPSKRLGIDKEIKVCRVAINAQQLYHYTKYETHCGEFPNQI
jgi:hypothetical protein